MLNKSYNLYIMIRYLRIGFILLFLISSSSSLSTNFKKKPLRKIIVNYLNNKKRLQDNSIIQTTNKYIGNMKTIIQDDIVNDVLYLFKFYNLSNDTINSYTYIFLYEFISYIINYNYTVKNNENEKIKKYRLTLFRQSIIRIIIYIIVKNLMLNNLLHSLIHL